MAFLSAKLDQDNSNDRAQYGSGQDSEKNQRHSQECTDHRHHLDVAESHAFNATDAKEYFAGEPQHASADNKSCQAGKESDPARAEAEISLILQQAGDKGARCRQCDANKNSQPDSVKRDHVRKNAMVDIDEGERYERCGEKEVDAPFQSHPELQIQHHTD